MDSMNLTKREVETYAVGVTGGALAFPTGTISLLNSGASAACAAVVGTAVGLIAALVVYLVGRRYFVGESAPNRKQHALDASPASIDAEIETTDDGPLVALHDSALDEPAAYYTPTDAQATADALHDAIEGLEVSE